MRIAYIDSQNIHKGVLECGRTIDRARFYNYIKNKHQIDVIKLFFSYVKEFEWLYSSSKLLIKLLHVNQIQDLQMLKNKVNKKP